MSDIHIKVLLARVEMSGPAMRVMGDEGPRNKWAPLADETRANIPQCAWCGSHNALQCATTLKSGSDGMPICAVRYAEMRKARR